jgi:hypothetical protein
MIDPPTFMEPAAAAAVLVRTLTPTPRGTTVADASVASGLPLRDAESGLTWLTSEFRGQYRVTEAGDLVHVFPHGFTKPWETRELLGRFVTRAGAVVAGFGRFVVRAWLLIAIVAYAAIFVAIALGLGSGRDDSNGRSSGDSLLGALLRMVAEAFYWTFHPFSPLAYHYGGWSDRAADLRQREPGTKVPFYEKVNRFVLGPTAPARDPHADRARILAEVRALDGRVALADVMRVTGLSREEADPLMARLMLDHDGSVEVSEGAGIFYRFTALRRTAGDTSAKAARPSAAWETPETLRPLTGNDGATNVGIAALNGFNLVAALVAIANDLTLSNLPRLFDKHHPYVPVPDGVPVVLGLIPLVFSLALFAIPVARAVARTQAKRRVAAENARLGVLREVITRSSRGEAVPEAAIRTAVRVATGSDPSDRDLARRVAEFGGEPTADEAGEIQYRFPELEADADAARDDRAGANPAEAQLGSIAFDTARELAAGRR